MRPLATFCASLATHAVGLALCFGLMARPFFVSPVLALCLALLLFVVVGACHFSFTEGQNARSFAAGLIAAVIVLLSFLTLVDWIVSIGEHGQTDFTSLIAYLRQIPSELSAVMVYVLSPLAAWAASRVGQYLGNRWSMRSHRAGHA